MDRVTKRDTIKQRVLLIAIFILFLVTRLWQLTTLPTGMHIDEAGMAYDAWCLSNWGVDRHLKSWPVYLMNFTSGQSSLYAFLCAFLFRIFGYSIWMVRMPSVIFSFLTLIFGMKIARHLYPNQVYPSLLAGGLMVIGPYFIMAGRLGLDCNLMLGVSTVFLYSFMMAIETQKRWRYIVTGLIGGILLYSYVLTYIVLPLFLFFSLLYVIYSKKFSFVNWVLMAIPLAVLAFPLILVQAVNYFDLPEMQLGIFTITKMMRYRISEIGNFSLDNFTTALRSIFVVVLLAAEGLWVLINHIKNFKAVLLVMVCGIYLVGFVRFGVFYYSGRYAEATHMKSELMGVLLTDGIEFIEGDALRQAGFAEEKYDDYSVYYKKSDTGI